LTVSVSAQLISNQSVAVTTVIITTVFYSTVEVNKSSDRHQLITRAAYITCALIG
jgi:hypothetical protein